MFLTQLHARRLSRGHNWAYKLLCKPCSAWMKNECQLQLARDSFNHNDTLCSTEASDSPATAVWRVSPKEAQFSPQFTLLHTPGKAAVTALNCWVICGFLEKGSQFDLLPQHETNYWWLRGSLGRKRATGSSRKLHRRAMHQGSNGLSCCLTQDRAGKLLSRNKCLAEAAEPPPGWLGNLRGKLSHWDPKASV